MAKDRYTSQAKAHSRRTLLYLRTASKGAAKANVKIGLVVKRAAMKNVPVRTGNLRASGYVVTDLGIEDAGGKFKDKGAAEMQGDHLVTLAKTKARIAALKSAVKRVGAVGFSAIYALAVHENPTSGAPGANLDLESELFKLGGRKGKKKPVQFIHSKVGAWKFLQRAFESTRSRLPEIYKSETRKQIRKDFVR